MDMLFSLINVKAQQKFTSDSYSITSSLRGIVAQFFFTSVLLVLIYRQTPLQ